LRLASESLPLLSLLGPLEQLALAARLKVFE
jgi:hypothetical protein